MIDDIIIVVVVVSVRFVNKEKKKWHIYGFLNECDVIIQERAHIHFNALVASTDLYIHFKDSKENTIIIFLQLPGEERIIC